MKAGSGTFWAQILSSAQNILLQESKLIPAPTELQRKKLILRATEWMTRPILDIYPSSPLHVLPPFLTVWYVIESCLWLIYIIFCPSPRHVTGRKAWFPSLTQPPSEKEAMWFKLIYTVLLCRNIWETRLPLLILTSPYQFLSARYISVIFKRISPKPMTWKLDSLCSWYKMSNCSQLLIHVQCMHIKRVWWARFCPKFILCWKWHVCKNVILQVTCWESLRNNLLLAPLGTAGFCNSSAMRTADI